MTAHRLTNISHSRPPSASTAVKSKNAKPPKTRLLIWLAAIVVVTTGLWAWWGRETMVMSEAGYQISYSLLAACNLQDARRIEAVKTRLDSLALSDQERDKIVPIFELANQGQWNSAAQLAKELLQSQDTP
jgi:hypothetical protein